MYRKLLIILTLTFGLLFIARGQADFVNGFVVSCGQTGNVSQSFGEVFYHQRKSLVGSEVADGLQQAQLLREVYDTVFCQNDVKPVCGFDFHSVDAAGNLVTEGQYDSSHYCASLLNYDSLTDITLTVWPVYELYDTLRLSYGEMLAMRYVPGRNDSLLRSDNDCDSLLHHMVYVCGFPNVADADANNYGNVFLGNDCWLNSNLRTTHYTIEAAARQGTCTTALSMIYSSQEFPDENHNFAVYGRLYTWNSTVGLSVGSTDAPVATLEGFVQGICPNGWHIPSATNINDLMDYGVATIASDSLWIVSMGDNSSGFNALPAGFYNPGRDRFEGMLGVTRFWATESVSETIAKYCTIEVGCDQLIERNSDKNFGFSVRCLKDNVYSETKWTKKLRKVPKEELSVIPIF